MSSCLLVCLLVCSKPRVLGKYIPDQRWCILGWMTIERWFQQGHAGALQWVYESQDRCPYRIVFSSALCSNGSLYRCQFVPASLQLSKTICTHAEEEDNIDPMISCCCCWTSEVLDLIIASLCNILS